MAFHEIEAHAVMAQPTGNEKKKQWQQQKSHGVGFETTKSRKHRNTAFLFPADKLSQNAEKNQVVQSLLLASIGLSYQLVVII